MGEWVRLCGRTELAPGEARRFEVGGKPVALVRIGDELYAISDVCSHEEYSLSEGEVLADEREIECGKHGSTFDLRTGEARSLPATAPVATFEVRIDGTDVMVSVP